MGKIYELDVTKCSSTYVGDRGVDHTNWSHNNGHKGYIERFLDEQLFAGKPVYFEEKGNADKYINEFLETLTNTTHITYKVREKEWERKLKVLDIQVEATDYEDSVIESSGTLNAIRIVLLDETEGEYDMFPQIVVLSYELEVKEKEVID